MNRNIEVIVASSGELKIEAMNFTGADCEKATKFLEEALGVSTNRQKKPEYFNRRNSQRTQRVGQ
jgi:hypothetical protein